jgi:hypothetical protein
MTRLLLCKLWTYKTRIAKLCLSVLRFANVLAGDSFALSFKDDHPRVVGPLFIPVLQPPAMHSIMLLLSERGSEVVDIDRGVQSWNFACQSLCIIGMAVFFGLRLYTRMFILSGFGKEDCERTSQIQPNRY